MGLSFCIEYEVFGEVKTVELKLGGSKIAVTADNRLGWCFDHRLRSDTCWSC